MWQRFWFRLIVLWTALTWFFKERGLIDLNLGLKVFELRFDSFALGSIFHFELDTPWTTCQFGITTRFKPYGHWVVRRHRMNAVKASVRRELMAKDPGFYPVGSAPSARRASGRNY